MFTIAFNERGILKREPETESLNVSSFTVSVPVHFAPRHGRDRAWILSDSEIKWRGQCYEPIYL